MTTHKKTKILFELGEISQNGKWQDYLQYGFDESDVDDLLELVADEVLNQADDESKEVWVPLHAWRTLGQIASDKATAGLIAQFDTLFDDDWALTDLPVVLGMIGKAAIGPLAAYINETDHDEFARVMAVDALAEIATQQPQCRDRVVQSYQRYMTSPDLTMYSLNGLLIGCLVDLEAREAINEIRLLFEKDCVDFSVVGDLEEIEVVLGLRDKRSTPKPNFYEMEKKHRRVVPDTLKSDDFFEILDYYLKHYANDDSVQGVSELDGYYAALGCAPNNIMPSIWMPAIWGDEADSPQWKSKKELEDFTQAVFTHYNFVMQSLSEGEYEALFLETEIEGETYNIVDEWCIGFLRGINLWGPMTATDAAITDECIDSIRLFATEQGYEQLDAMERDDVVLSQQKIEPDLQRLYQFFYAQRIKAAQPVVHEEPKAGRNDACPCGSGKKFKKCCLH